MFSHGNGIETIPTGIRTIKHQCPSLCMQINQQTKPGLRSPMSQNYRAKPINDVLKYLSPNKEDPVTTFSSLKYKTISFTALMVYNH